MRRWVIFGVLGLAVALGLAVWLSLAVPRPGVSAGVTRGTGTALGSRDFYRATVENRLGHRASVVCRVQAIAHGREDSSDWFFTPRLNDRQTYRVARGMVPVTGPWVPTSGVDQLRI